DPCTAHNDIRELGSSLAPYFLAQVGTIPGFRQKFGTGLVQKSRAPASPVPGLILPWANALLWPNSGSGHDNLKSGSAARSRAASILPDTDWNGIETLLLLLYFEPRPRPLAALVSRTLLP
ncbi:MAG: hypothetical protein O7C61_01360, partial [SAR324 cluster bacterium]|nr:hypothetical protein [SAR324 cluster bacterium]